jgi:acyl dehydratase
LTSTLSLQAFRDLPGRELGPSEWLLIDQARIDAFAAATNDHQFIHVDPERAAGTPFGGTIAHGFLSLSLLTHLNQQFLPVPEGTVMGVNYGSDKVRYLTPVRAGQRIRSRVKVLSVVQKTPGRWLARYESRVEIEGEKKPALVAHLLSLYVIHPDSKS